MATIKTNPVDLVELTADIVSAYVTKNAVPATDLPGVIASVHAAMRHVLDPKAPEPARLEPRVSIKKSITPEHLISLEDGRPYKTLKRHLTRLGLTPAAYRQKWGLPSDYPMVAPNYSARRSALAKTLGLGQLQPRKKGSTKAASTGDAGSGKGRRGPRKAAA